MFDNIAAPLMPCPVCEYPVGNWQSKDGPCEMINLPPEAVKDYYSYCSRCSEWIEFKRKDRRERFKRSYAHYSYMNNDALLRRALRIDHIAWHKRKKNA